MMFAMSRAFVKESDQDAESLPERAISPHPNLVTARGLALLEARVRELEAERSAARAANDSGRAGAHRPRPALFPGATRQRQAPISAAPNPDQVRFGVRALLQLPDGATQSFQLVGEDEADPKAGLISYVSPLATSLMGLRVGDELPFAGADRRDHRAGELGAADCSGRDRDRPARASSRWRAGGRAHRGSPARRPRRCVPHGRCGRCGARSPRARAAVRS